MPEKLGIPSLWGKDRVNQGRDARKVTPLVYNDSTTRS